MSDLFKKLRLNIPQPGFDISEEVDAKPKRLPQSLTIAEWY